MGGAPLQPVSGVQSRPSRGPRPFRPTTRQMQCNKVSAAILV